jgi:hypothetical protein
VYKERSRYLEYDAGMSRAEAEAAAWSGVFRNRRYRTAEN